MTFTGDVLDRPAPTGPGRGSARVAVGTVVLMIAGIYALVVALATTFAVLVQVDPDDSGPVAYVDTDPYAILSWPSSLVGPGPAVSSDEFGTVLVHCLLALLQVGLLVCLGWALRRGGGHRRLPGVVALVLVGLIASVAAFTYVPRVTATDPSDPEVRATESRLAGAMEGSGNLGDGADCMVRLVHQAGSVDYADSFCEFSDGSSMSVPVRITDERVVELPSDGSYADDMDRLFPRNVQRALRDVVWRP